MNLVISFSATPGSSWKKNKILMRTLYLLKPRKISWERNSLRLEDCEVQIPSVIIDTLDEWFKETLDTHCSVLIKSMELSKKEWKTLYSLLLADKIEMRS